MRVTSGCDFQRRGGFKTRPYVLLLMAFIAAQPVLAQETQSVRPTGSVRESSRPVFDPESVKEAPVQADAFLNKLRARHAEFTREERNRRLKFFEKIRQGSLEQAEKEKKLAAFRQDEISRQQEFFRSQQKKLERHLKKQEKKKKKALEKLVKKEQKNNRGQSDPDEGRLREAGGGAELPQDQEAA